MEDRWVKFTESELIQLHNVLRKQGAEDRRNVKLFSKISSVLLDEETDFVLKDTKINLQATAKEVCRALVDRFNNSYTTEIDSNTGGEE